MSTIDFLKFNNCIAWIIFPNTANVITNEQSISHNIDENYLLINGTKASYFNGTSYVILPNYTLGPTFSVSLWFNCAATPVTTSTIYSAYSEDRTSSIVVDVDSNNILSFTCTDGNTTVKLEHPILNAKWYHVVAIHTSNGSVLYVNGVCVDCSVAQLELSVIDAYSIVGCNSEDKYFTGYIKNLMVFNSFLFKNIVRKLNYLTYINGTPFQTSFTVIPDATVATVYIPEESVLDPIPIVAPVAEFTADIVSGYSPLVVQFTDQSLNNPTEWEWYFNGDGIPDSTEQNPTYTFNTAGSHDVSLICSNVSGQSTATKNSYISVSAPQPSQVTRYATDDTTTWEDDPDGLSGEGSWYNISAGDGAALEFNGYIQFNIVDITLPCSSAILRLYHNYYEWNGGYPGYITIKRVISTFSENSVTWDSPPNVTNVGSFDYLVPDPAGWVEIDVTALLNASDGTTFGIMLDMCDVWLQAHFSSKEGEHPPELVITL